MYFIQVSKDVTSRLRDVAFSSMQAEYVLPFQLHEYLIFIIDRAIDEKLHVEK